MKNQRYIIKCNSCGSSEIGEGYVRSMQYKCECGEENSHRHPFRITINNIECNCNYLNPEEEDCKICLERSI